MQNRLCYIGIFGHYIVGHYSGMWENIGAISPIAISIPNFPIASYRQEALGLEIGIVVNYHQVLIEVNNSYSIYGWSTVGWYNSVTADRIACYIKNEDSGLSSNVCVTSCPCMELCSQPQVLYILCNCAMWLSSSTNQQIFHLYKQINHFTLFVKNFYTMQSTHIHVVSEIQVYVTLPTLYLEHVWANFEKLAI